MSDRPRILLIGATGQVGWELVRELAPLGEVHAAARAMDNELRIDLEDPDSICDLMRRVQPELVVNAAAYTAVDRAEQEPQRAEAINAIAPGIIAEEAKRLGVGLVHYSTDYVFPGDVEQPYRETDPTGPKGIYGSTKLAGEQAVLDSGAACLILRTAWVYGARGHNFLLTMLRRFRAGQPTRVVHDQIGSPTWSRMIAAATAQVLAQRFSADGRFDLEPVRGVYHLTAAGHISWHGFAQAIREHAGLDCLLEAIPSTEYPTPAARPVWSVLDGSRMRETFHIELPHWRSSLGQCLDDMRLHPS